MNTVGRGLPCLFVFALILAMAVGCRQVDVREVRLATPGVGCEDCAARLRKALASYPAIDLDRTVVDTTNGVTLVTYDSMRLALKNIEFAILRAGFDANDLKADAQARAALPPECRAHTD